MTYIATKPIYTAPGVLAFAEGHVVPNSIVKALKLDSDAVKRKGKAEEPASDSARSASAPRAAGGAKSS